jgi:LysM repeat protein
VDRSGLTRWAAPVVFLAAITIGALVVRAGIDQGSHHHAKTPTTVTTTKKKTRGHRPKRVYTIVQGDTLAAIAAKTGTTVAALVKLNPGINPTALRVGQKIRVQ